LSAVAAGRIPAGASADATLELELVLRLLGKGYCDARAGLPSARVFPVTTDGATRRCGILTSWDALVLNVPQDPQDWEIDLGCLGVSSVPDLPPKLNIEYRAGGQWVLLGQWSTPLDGRWKGVRVAARTLPERCSELRLAVEGQAGMVLLAEPMLLRRDVPSRRPNLVLIDLDTVRADRLGCYGYEDRPTSPALDSLLIAKGFAVFTRAYSSAPWTVPATARFLASRYQGANQDRSISEGTTMLAEILRDAGYYCAAYTGGMYLRTPGFDQGFHEYHWSQDIGKAEDTFPPASQWLQEAPQPFFLFLHTYEAHTPYTRTTFCKNLPRGRLHDPAVEHRFFLPDTLNFCSSLTSAESLYVQALYDGGVREACDAVVDLFATLDELDLWHDTAVVLLSDHGEELWERFDVFAWHSHSLYAEVLNVPFMIRDPARRRFVQVDEPVTTVDLVPTVAEMLRLTWGGAADGVSICPLMDGGHLEREVPIMASGLAPNAPTDGVCVYGDRAKYVEFWKRGGATREAPTVCPPHPAPGQELYRFDLDPREVRDLRDTQTELAEALAESSRSALSRSLPPIESGDAVSEGAISADLRRQLAALGYATSD
jgi:arylsulfatase A-like enzyme